MMAAPARKIWVDGQLVDFDEAKVHVLSHSLHYGVGVFEGIRAYPTPRGAAIFRLSEHVDRLVRSAKIYHLPLPYTPDQIAGAVIDTQAANDIVPSYLRPIVYRGDPGLGVKNQTGKVSLAIGAVPAKKYLGEGSEAGVRAKISPFRKPRSDALPSFAKATGNYLNGYLAGIDALREGYEEAILLDANGFVAEGTGENIFLVRGGKLYTPGTESDILLGITRDSVIRLATDLGYPVVEKLISVSELLSADEAFFAGTFAELAPIRQIGSHTIGSGNLGPVSRALLDAFGKAVRGEDGRYDAWLTPVRAVVPTPPARPRRR